MDWKTLKPELLRLLAYFVLYLSGQGAYAKFMPTLPTLPPAPPVIINPPAPVPPPTIPPGLPVPKVDPEAAIVRIGSGNAGCTATIIGPSPVPGVQLALSAAHCVSGKGAAVRIWHKSGKIYDGSVYRYHRESDLSLIVFKTPDVLSYAKIAEACPAEGVKIWHMGYGVNRPGNRESGTVIRNGCEGGFVKFQILVSSGDSGCGFFREDNGELVATCYGTGGGYTIGPGVTAIRKFLRDASTAMVETGMAA